MKNSNNEFAQVPIPLEGEEKVDIGSKEDFTADIRKLKDIFAHRVMFILSTFVAGLLFLMVLGLFLRAKPVLLEKPIGDIFLSSVWRPADGKFGLASFIAGMKIGSVLYGSGYVLLAFLHADFVVRLGWLTDRQLIDAVAIGQVTPGPVFTTATFIGFILDGTPGAILATIGIFSLLLFLSLFPIL